MSLQRFPIGTRETRLLLLRHEGYLDDVWDTYVKRPDATTDRIVGGLSAGASVILEGPDQAYRALIGQEYVRPNGIAGRTRRDVAALLKDVVTLHPLRAIGDAWRLATSDIPLDSVDMLTGLRNR